LIHNTSQDLCDEALGAADYIHIAETFHVIFLSDVPVLNPRARNEVSVGFEIM
jgi:cell division protein ZapE